MQEHCENASLYSCLDLDDDRFSDISGEDIRKAYLRLAAIWHPDKCALVDCVSRFQKIQEAYRILSDDVLRKEYDSARLQKPILHSESVELSDFIDSGNSTYMKPCRCGESFIISQQQLDEGYNAVQCNGCSLFVDIVNM